MSTSKSNMSSNGADGTHDMGVGPGNGPILLTVEALAAGGKGVARVAGKVWLVEGGFPGDRVEAVARRDRGNWVEAVATTLVAPGPGRREPPCPVQGVCGGCPWMPLPEEEQRAWKRRIVVDALVRIGRVAEPPVAETRVVGPALRYRNRVEFTVGPDASGKRVLGLHPAGSATEWVDVERCLLQTEEADAILATLRWFVLQGPGASDRDWDPRDEPVRVAIRWSEEASRAVVVLRSPGPPPSSAGTLAAALLKRHRTVRGMVHVRSSAGRRGGGEVRVLAGEGRVDETVGGVRVPIPADAFTQVQTEGAAILGERVVAHAASPRTVLELFGGMGGFALALARGGAEVRVVEADPAAVDAGRRAAEAAGLSSRVRFHRARVDRFLAARRRGDPVPQVVVADPPRTGLGKPVAAALAAIGAPRLVLVSCDPGTFARDARVLLDGGYRLEAVDPVDLFPQTPHVETVARFSLPGSRAAQGAAGRRREKPGAPPRPASG